MLARANSPHAWGWIRHTTLHPLRLYEVRARIRLTHPLDTSSKRLGRRPLDSRRKGDTGGQVTVAPPCTIIYRRDIASTQGHLSSVRPRATPTAATHTHATDGIDDTLHRSVTVKTCVGGEGRVAVWPLQGAVCSRSPSETRATWRMILTLLAC